jgi:high-affinity Fe2+/Pb2+ permease
LRATVRSIGMLGMVLVAALVGALVWVMIDWGLLSLENRSFNVWLGIIVLSVVLGIGLSWSIARRRLTGQADIDDVDE